MNFNLTYYPNTESIMELLVPDTLNSSYRITAYVSVNDRIEETKSDLN
jgi:hypothetical protein